MWRPLTLVNLWQATLRCLPLLLARQRSDRRPTTTAAATAHSRSHFVIAKGEEGDGEGGMRPVSAGPPHVVNAIFISICQKRTSAQLRFNTLCYSITLKENAETTATLAPLFPHMWKAIDNACVTFSISFSKLSRVFSLLLLLYLSLPLRCHKSE